jgi:CRP/FNR family cyclic AMP-dependent transcriptional regulator
LRHATRAHAVPKPDLFNYDQPAGALPESDAGVILRKLSTAEWDTFVTFCESLRFAPGECIVRAGESGRAIYIIRAGHVRGELATGRKKVATQKMGPGTVFGELAFFDGGPRSATLWADDTVELLHLPLAAFERLAAWHPRVARELLLDLGRVLSQRLRRAESKA